MSWLALILALPVALVGGWYLVNPQAAARLAEIEGRVVNRRRVLLRQTNGVVLLLLSIALYVAISRTFGTPRVEGRVEGVVAGLAWMATMLLVLIAAILALLDLRLTRTTRRRLHSDRRSSSANPSAAPENVR